MLKKNNNVEQGATRGTITLNKPRLVRRVVMLSKQRAIMLKKQGVARGVVALNK
jgi:hypothetical protein